MSPDNLSVLVIGANGQVGTELRRRASVSVKLCAFDRHALDIGDRAAVAAAVTDLRPDVIINAAAFTGVDAAETAREDADRVNRQGPAHLAAAAAAAGAALIHLSTDYVFDGSGRRPYRANDPVAPLGVYGLSKEAGERAVRTTLARHVILRTAWVYAAHGVNFVRTMLRVGADRDHLRVVDDQRGTPTSAADIADACLAIAARLANDVRGETAGTYHYVAAGEASWADLADAIFDHVAPIWGRRPVVERITTAEYPTPARRPAYSVLACDLVERVFAPQRRPWRAGLDDVLRELSKKAPNGGEGSKL